MTNITRTRAERRTGLKAIDEHASWRDVYEALHCDVDEGAEGRTDG